jgi:hypothetical protein
MHIVKLLQWLSETQFSSTIRDSVWVEPAIETVHILTLTLFMAFIVLLDFRLLGVLLVSQPVSRVHTQLNRWTSHVSSGGWMPNTQNW